MPVLFKLTIYCFLNHLNQQPNFWPTWGEADLGQNDYTCNSQDMSSSLQVFAFKGQNMMFAMNMLFTCILYCQDQL